MIELKTDRSTRLTPQQEMHYLKWFSGGVLFLFMVTYFLAESKNDFYQSLNKTANLIIFLFIIRHLPLAGSSLEYYKETINYIFGNKENQNYDEYIKSSLWNTLFNISMLFILLVLIHDDNISIIRGVISIVLFALYLLFAYIKARLKLRK